MATGATSISVTPTGGAASNTVSFTVDAPVVVPVLATILPNHALVGGSVTLSGTNFGSSGVVSFGGTSALITSWSASSITVTVPSVATGSTTVSVTPTGGQTSNSVGFLVDAPQVVAALTSVAPNHALVGASVVLTGTDLGMGGAISFGGTAAVASAWSPTSITVTVPTMATGATTITVTPNGAAASNALGFTVDAPVVVPALTSVTPHHGLVGASVVLTGTNLGTGGAVRFGGTVAVATAWSATSITVKVPSRAVGATTVSVTPTGSSATNALAFTVDAKPVVKPLKPVVKAIAPLRGKVGSKVTLTGINFGKPGWVKFGTLKAKVVSWTAKKIVVKVPTRRPGVVVVTVTPLRAPVSNSKKFTIVK
jgi:hypothetical protein